MCFTGLLYVFFLLKTIIIYILKYSSLFMEIPNSLVELKKM